MSTCKTFEKETLLPHILGEGGEGGARGVKVIKGGADEEEKCINKHNSHLR